MMKYRVDFFRKIHKTEKLEPIHEDNGDSIEGLIKVANSFSRESASNNKFIDPSIFAIISKQNGVPLLYGNPSLTEAPAKIHWSPDYYGQIIDRGIDDA